MMKLVLIFIVCSLVQSLILFVVSQKTNVVGGRIVVPTSSVSLLMNKLMPKLQQDIPKIPLPDVSGSIGTIIGDINYVISAIHIRQFAVETTTAELLPPNLIKGTINNAFVDLSANWGYKQAGWPYFGDAGSCDGNVGVSGDFSVSVSIDPVSKSMKFKLASFGPKINNINIQLHGGASWFYNIFLSLFQNQIIGMITDKLATQVPVIIESVLQQEITNLYNPFAPIGDGELVSDCQFVSVDVTEKFIGVGVPTTGIPRTDLPKFEPAYLDQNYQILLDEYYFNSLGWALVKNGKLAGLTMSSDDVSSNFKQFFDTNTFASTIPELANNFPNRKMKIEIGPGSDLIGFSLDKTTGMTGIADLIFRFSVLDPLVTNVFSLKISIIAHVDLRFVDYRNAIFADLSILDWKSSVDSSKIGGFNAESFKNLISEINSSILLPIASKFSNLGLSIPSIQGMMFKGFKFEVRDGYLMVVGMMDYVPSETKRSSKKN